MNLSPEQLQALVGADRRPEGNTKEEPPVDKKMQRLIDDSIKDPSGKYIDDDDVRDEIIRKLKKEGRGYALTREVSLKQGAVPITAGNTAQTEGVMMYHELLSDPAPPVGTEEELMDKWGDI